MTEDRYVRKRDAIVDAIAQREEERKQIRLNRRELLELNRVEYVGDILPCNSCKEPAHLSKEQEPNGMWGHVVWCPCRVGESSFTAESAVNMWNYRMKLFL